MQSDLNSYESESVQPTYVEIRLLLGEAWLMCLDCNAKICSFDGDKDKAIRCPYLKNGKCEL